MYMVRTSNHEVSQFEDCHDISWSYNDHKKLKKKLDEIKGQGTTVIPNSFGRRIGIGIWN